MNKFLAQTVPPFGSTHLLLAGAPVDVGVMVFYHAPPLLEPHEIRPCGFLIP